MQLEGADIVKVKAITGSAEMPRKLRTACPEDRFVVGDKLRIVMSSIMRRRRRLNSAISVLPQLPH